MAGFEDVVHVVERELVLVDGAGLEGRGFLEGCRDSGRGRFLRWSLTGSRASWGRDRRRDIVDEFDDHVVVAAGGGGVDVGEDFAGERPDPC